MIKNQQKMEEQAWEIGKNQETTETNATFLSLTYCPLMECPHLGIIKTTSYSGICTLLWGRSFWVSKEGNKASSLSNNTFTWGILLNSNRFSTG